MLEIANLELKIISSNMISSSQWNKLGQIHVKWCIKTKILRYASACSLQGTQTVQRARFAAEQVQMLFALEDTYQHNYF